MAEEHCNYGGIWSIGIFQGTTNGNCAAGQGCSSAGKGDTLPAFIGLLHITYTQNPGTFLGVSYAHAMIFGYDVILYR